MNVLHPIPACFTHQHTLTKPTKEFPFLPGANLGGFGLPETRAFPSQLLAYLYTVRRDRFGLSAFLFIILKFQCYIHTSGNHNIFPQRNPNSAKMALGWPTGQN